MKLTLNTTGSQAPAAPTAGGAIERRLSKLESLLAEKQSGLPIWIRAPKQGHEHYTGFSRSKLYELATTGKIRSVSIREPGAIKGTRLFNLQSVLSFITINEEGGAPE